MNQRQLNALHAAAGWFDAADTLPTIADDLGALAQVFEASINADDAALHRMLVALARALVAVADDQDDLFNAGARASTGASEPKAAQ